MTDPQRTLLYAEVPAEATVEGFRAASGGCR